MYKTLIVDDEFWMLEGLKRVLKRDCPDFSVVATAKDGLQAIEYLNHHEVDVIITDIRMEKMDGIELLQNIRARGLQIPVLIISAHSDFEYAKEVLHYGAFDYILKPLNRGELIDALERMKPKLTAKPFDRSQAKILSTKSPMQGKEVIETIKQAIQEKYMKDLSIVDFAEMLDFNASYLSRLFKQETSKGFVQYLTEHRLGIAITLMMGSDDTITDIARRVGYADYKHFRKVFRQHTGLSPSDYRKKHMPPTS